MRHTAVTAVVVASLMGCSATAEDPGDAPPGSEAANVIPTDQPVADGAGAATAASESASQDNPLAGMQPCDLITDDEAAQLELGEAQSQGDACAWTYTGAADDVVYAIVAFQHEQSSLDHFIELGYVPVPGKLGNHEAAVGVLEDESGLVCQVPVVVGESAVVVGTASPAFSDPDDPLCGDFSNDLARLVEPKLPVVDTSASVKKADAAKSGKDNPLAQVQPCDLITDDEAAQLGLTHEADSEQGKTKQCAWLYDGDGSNERMGVFLSFEAAGINEISGDNITPVPSIGSHDAATFVSASNASAVAIGVGEKSRADVMVSGMQLGQGPPDQSKAGQIAMDVATLVEPKLP